MNQSDTLYQARLHSLNKYISDEELEEDLLRIKHIKKLIGRLKNGYINERLIINHFVILFNVFEYSFVITMLKKIFNEIDWIYANTFLVFLKRSLDLTNIDDELLIYLKERI